MAVKPLSKPIEDMTERECRRLLDRILADYGRIEDAERKLAEDREELEMQLAEFVVLRTGKWKPFQQGEILESLGITRQTLKAWTTRSMTKLKARRRKAAREAKAEAEAEAAVTA